MSHKVFVAVLITALIAATALYRLDVTPLVTEEVNALDMTCGFTDDFAKFIKDNGKYLLI
jgi:hypothetical protein